MRTTQTISWQKGGLHQGLIFWNGPHRNYGLWKQCLQWCFSLRDLLLILWCCVGQPYLGPQAMSREGRKPEDSPMALAWGHASPHLSSWTPGNGVPRAQAACWWPRLRSSVASHRHVPSGRGPQSSTRTVSVPAFPPMDRHRQHVCPKLAISGCPVVRTRCFHCCEPGFSPWLGN